MALSIINLYFTATFIDDIFNGSNYFIVLKLSNSHLIVNIYFSVCNSILHLAAEYNNDLYNNIT